MFLARSSVRCRIVSRHVVFVDRSRRGRRRLHANGRRHRMAARPVVPREQVLAAHAERQTQTGKHDRRPERNELR